MSMSLARDGDDDVAGRLLLAASLLHLVPTRLYVASTADPPPSQRGSYNPLESIWLELLAYLPGIVVILALVSWSCSAVVPARLVPRSVRRAWHIAADDYISDRSLAAAYHVRSDEGETLRRGIVGTKLRGEYTPDGKPRYARGGAARQSWRIALLSLVSLAQSVATAYALGRTLTIDSRDATTFDVWRLASSLLAWVFVLAQCVFSHPTTAPMLALVIVTALWISDMLSLAAYLPTVTNRPALEWLPQVLPRSSAVLGTTLALVLILKMPVSTGGFDGQVPLEERERLAADELRAEGEDLQVNYELRPTTPEDYTNLLASFTYTWMNPIQALALRRSLEPCDIWRMRSINDVEMLNRRFQSTRERVDAPTGREKRLLWRLMRANAKDVLVDMAWKVAGVTLAYATPALMKVILDCISSADAIDRHDAPHRRAGGHSGGADAEPDWTPREEAFFLACVSFLISVLRYVAELKNFHHARQAGLRARVLLTGELFLKALRRRGGAAGQAGRDVDAKSTGGDSKPRRASAGAGGNGQRPGEDDDDGGGEGEGEQRPLLDGAEVPEEKHQATEDATKAESADVGKIVNMMANDINVLLRIFCDAHQLYGAPMEVIIASALLYRIMGWSSLGGLALLVLAIPLNRWMGSRLVEVTRDYRSATDHRTSLVSELIGAIRWIKLQGVETAWSKRVQTARDVEMRALIRSRIFEFLFVVAYTMVPIATMVFSFYLYVAVQGEQLTVSVAFTSIALYSMLRNALNIIPGFAVTLLQGLVSVRRLEAFLEEQEVDEWVSSLRWKECGQPGGDVRDAPAIDRVAIEQGTFSYGGAPRPARATATAAAVGSFVLRDVNVDFPVGGLSVVTGPVASGKSTLLLSLLGETRCHAGRVHLAKFAPGSTVSRVSYAGQSPWLEAGKSIKANIVFVAPWDAARYAATVHACALEEDLREFEDGDETRISKSTLSGGQRARIALARAVYAPSQVLICDDVLAAVDVRTQRHLFAHALTGKLAEGRTVILATHHLGLVLPSADHAVVLRGGRVVAAGRPDLLLKSRAIVLPTAGISADGLSQEEEREAPSTPSGDLDGGAPAEASGSSTPSSAPPGKDAKDAKHARLLYQEERRRRGAVRFAFYSLYLRATSPLLWTLVVAFSVVFRLAGVAEQVWLKTWGESSERNGDGGSSSSSEQAYYLVGFALLGVSEIVLNSVRFAFFWMATYQASKRIYRRLLGSVVGAPLRFFDVNPAGRILQRFNLDINVIDSELPGSTLNLFRNLLGLVSYLIICAVIVPWFLLPAALLFATGPWLVRGYLAATRDIQRIESVSTSPLYSVFTDSMAGAAVIRAFGAEERMVRYMTSIVSITMSQWFAICTLDVWLSFRAQILGGGAVFIATILALTGAVSPGAAGLVLTSAGLTTQLAYYLTHDYKGVSNNLNSVERISEYIDLPQEEQRNSVDGEAGGRPLAMPPAAWPSSEGEIHVEDLTVRYAPELPPVLHSVSFQVRAREKVALVGRTGSGKSTIASALLRAVAFDAGRIIIDGIDVASVPLHALRSRVCIVPQDPVLFSGTLRSNLDPFGEHEDAQLIQALARVHIHAKAPSAHAEGAAGADDGLDTRDDFSAVPHADHDESGRPSPPVGLLKGAGLTLDTPVVGSASGGSNFSAGEAQLLALARALLRDARVVILDEATSNVDHETDAAIQSAIASLPGCVLTIAHRLDTIISYDRIIVLSAGRVVEFDTPAQLLRRRPPGPHADGPKEGGTGGLFRAMCEQSGRAAFVKLCRAAGVGDEDEEGEEAANANGA